MLFLMTLRDQLLRAGVDEIGLPLPIFIDLLNSGLHDILPRVDHVAVVNSDISLHVVNCVPQQPTFNLFDALLGLAPLLLWFL